jgi:hypothetical protein
MSVGASADGIPEHAPIQPVSARARGRRPPKTNWQTPLSSNSPVPIFVRIRSFFVHSFSQWVLFVVVVFTPFRAHVQVAPRHLMSANEWVCKTCTFVNPATALLFCETVRPAELCGSRGDVYENMVGDPQWGCHEPHHHRWCVCEYGG